MVFERRLPKVLRDDIKTSSWVNEYMQGVAEQAALLFQIVFKVLGDALMQVNALMSPHVVRLAWVHK